VTPPPTEPAPTWRTRRPVLVTVSVLSALVAAAALVWLVWAALGHATSPKIQMLGYEIHGRSVTVRFEVAKQPEDTVRCIVRARDAAGAEVARTPVTLRPGSGTERVSHTLRAVNRPVSGEVESCRAV
jgi:hypothetical protein